jgi:hypothetical protein
MECAIGIAAVADRGKYLTQVGAVHRNATRPKFSGTKSVMSSSSCRTSILRTLLLCVAAIAYLCPSPALCARAGSTRGVPSDVQYFACEACDHVAEAAVKAVSEIEPPLTEVAVLDVMEALCNPREKAGRWTRSVDLVERRRRLVMRAQDGVQECKVECATVALACEAVVEAVGVTELAEAAFKLANEAAAAGKPFSKKSFSAWMCAPGGPARVCDRKAPDVPASRPKGPPFLAKEGKDLEIEDMMANMKVPGMKMYQRDELKEMYSDDDDDDDGDKLGKSDDVGDATDVDSTEDTKGSDSTAVWGNREPANWLAGFQRTAQSGLKEATTFAQRAVRMSGQVLKKLRKRSVVDEL